MWTVCTHNGRRANTPPSESDTPLIIVNCNTTVDYDGNPKVLFVLSRKLNSNDFNIA